MQQPSYIAIVDGDSSLISQLAETEMADCPICNESLPLFSAFGICRARPSGRNLYCKACIRKKIADSRRELREYRDRQRRIPGVDTPAAAAGPRWLKDRYDANGVLNVEELTLRCNEHHERVFGAIYHGARTQRQIVRMTRLSFDAIGEPLAFLLLSHPQLIKTEILRDGERDVVRIYYPADQVSPARKPNTTAPASFSTLGGIVEPIMKGKAA